MNLYLISQNVNNSWETYDSAIVCAESKKEAQMMHPDEASDWNGKEDADWSDAKDVRVKKIGTAIKSIKKGVICASYNAG